MIFMNNKKIVGMTLISVLTLIIVASLIFAININFDKKEKETFNSDSSNLTDKEITSLISLIDIYDNYLITFDGDKEIDSLSNLDKINFIDRLDFNTKKELNLDFDTGVSLKKVEEVLKKYFGKDTSFSPVNSTCYLEDGDYLIYDPNTKMYKANNNYHAHGAYTPPSIINYYVEGKRLVDNDKLVYTITLKKAFAWPNTSNYYGTYTDLLNGTSLVVDLYDKYGEYDQNDISKLLEAYKDSFASYTYVFETKDSINNSYLTELKKQKTLTTIG